MEFESESSLETQMRLKSPGEVGESVVHVNRNHFAPERWSTPAALNKLGENRHAPGKERRQTCIPAPLWLHLFYEDRASHGASPGLRDRDSVRDSTRGP